MTDKSLKDGFPNPGLSPPWMSGALQRNTAIDHISDTHTESDHVHWRSKSPSSTYTGISQLVEVPPVPLPGVDDPLQAPTETFGFSSSSPGSGVKEPGCSSGKQSAERTSLRLGFRLRKRGRLANCLAHALDVSQGRWKDLAETGIQSRARAWLSGYMHSTGHGQIEPGELIFGGIKKQDGESAKTTLTSTVWVPFVGDNGHVRALLVAPELVAELAKKRIFRSMTSVLLGSLRGRACIWADERGISAMDLVRILPGSIALAVLPMPDECVALSSLRGTAGVYSSTVLARLEQGKLTSPNVAPLGTYLRGPLAWCFKQVNTRLLAPGVGTLTLPA